MASAAYRSGQRLVNESTGEIHHYSQKEQSVDHSMILAPDNAPSWARDRQKLWSAVEEVENRKNSQLAREIVVAIPRELDHSSKIELVSEYAKEQFVSRGMIADVCFHDLQTDNPHAHIMLTTRELDQAKGWAKNKNRDWNKKELVPEWRQAWAENANRHLKLAGLDETIDHRSYADQGKEQKPTKHLGHQQHALEKRGISTPTGDHNRKVAETNRLIESINSQIRKLQTQAKLLASNALQAVKEALAPRPEAQSVGFSTNRLAALADAVNNLPPRAEPEKPKAADIISRLKKERAEKAATQQEQRNEKQQEQSTNSGGRGRSRRVVKRDKSNDHDMEM